MRTTNTECIIQLHATILCNYSTPHPPTSIHVYLHYSIVGGGGGALPTHTQHTTTHNITKTVHNSTRIHKTTNVPVVFMALILNGFEECTIITRGIGRGGPWKSRLFWTQMALDFFGPKWHSLRLCHFRAQKSPDFQGSPLPNAPRNDVALLKTITYHAIKTTGTLIVNSMLASLRNVKCIFRP